jgi:hypothetical protein
LDSEVVRAVTFCISSEERSICGRVRKKASCSANLTHRHRVEEIRHREACTSEFEVPAQTCILLFCYPAPFLKLSDIVGFAGAIVALLGECAGRRDGEILLSTSSHGQRRNGRGYEA